MRRNRSWVWVSGRLHEAPRGGWCGVAGLLEGRGEGWGGLAGASLLKAHYGDVNTQIWRGRYCSTTRASLASVYPNWTSGVVTGGGEKGVGAGCGQTAGRRTMDQAGREGETQVGCGRTAGSG